jgi:virginiamycin B lyase
MRVVGKLLSAVAAIAACIALTTSPAYAESTIKGGFAQALTAGPDGDVWFSAGHESNQVVGKVTPSGTVTEYGVEDGGDPSAIVTGPDKSLWFTVRGEIGRITTSGEASYFPVPGESDLGLSGLAWGREGDLWFSEERAGAIGRMTPSGEFTVHRLPAGRRPSAIVLGAEGNLWFSERRGGRVGRITPTGAVTEFPAPGKTLVSESIALGPDGNLWFTDAKAPRVGRITPTGEVTFFKLPTWAGPKRSSPARKPRCGSPPETKSGRSAPTAASHGLPASPPGASTRRGR